MPHLRQMEAAQGPGAQPAEGRHQVDEAEAGRGSSSHHNWSVEFILKHVRVIFRGNAQVTFYFQKIIIVKHYLSAYS